MYFVEITVDVIFFARLYCMISKWSVGTKKKKKIKKIKEMAKKGENILSFIFFFGDKSLHAIKDRAFWYCFTRVQMFDVESWSIGQKWAKHLDVATE